MNMCSEKRASVSFRLDQIHASGIYVHTLWCEIHTLHCAETHSVDQEKSLKLLVKLNIETLSANKQLQQVSF